MATEPKGSQGGQKPSGDWRARLGHVLIGLAGGMGVNLLSSGEVYLRVAIIAAAGAILIGAGQLRRFPTEAPLVAFSSRTALFLAAGCAISAVFVPLPWSGYGVLGAALFAGAAVIPLERYRASRTLGGIACVGIGISLIGIGSSLLAHHPLVIILFELVNLAIPIIEGAAAIIGIGVSLIVGGVALLLQRSTLLSFAGVGSGISLIGAGLAFLPILNPQSITIPFLGTPISIPYNIETAFLPNIGAISVWLITAGTVAALGAGFAFPLVRSTLLGVAGIGLGISLISVGVALMLITGILNNSSVSDLTGWLICAGAFAVVLGVAFLLTRPTLIGMASIGLGFSLIAIAGNVQSVGKAMLAIGLAAGDTYPILTTGLAACGLIATVAGFLRLYARGRLLSVADVCVALSFIGTGVATHLIQDSALSFEGLASNAVLIAAFGTVVAIGAWAAVGAGVSAIGSGVTLPFARSILIGITGISLGISLVGVGIAARTEFGSFAVWLIFAGILLVPFAVAHMRNKYLLGGVTAIGFGAELTVAALYFIGRGSLFWTATIGAGLAAMVAGVVTLLSQANLRRWLLDHWDSWTRAPDKSP